MKPRLEHYPKWLREYIFPGIDQPAVSILGESVDRREFGTATSALRRLAEKAKHDPDSRIIFEMLLDGIRLKFKVSALEEKVEWLESRVSQIRGDSVT